ncbi:hypothetical protein GCM10027278_10190 [Paralcaligenes ginsengisoli]
MRRASRVFEIKGKFVQKLLIAMVLSAGALTGCAPMLAGQAAEAGYSAAKNSLGGVLGSSNDKKTALGEDARQQKLQSILNSIEVGQIVAPILDSMGEQPKEKSGNTYGYTCYEYPAVYSATDAAVIVAKNGKVVFFGNSRCVTEMQDQNFTGTGKYAGVKAS